MNDIQKTLFTMSISSKERMEEWKKLPENTITWECFKRLVSQFGMKRGIEKAKKMIDTWS